MPIAPLLRRLLNVQINIAGTLKFTVYARKFGLLVRTKSCLFAVGKLLLEIRTVRWLLPKQFNGESERHQI